MPDGDEFARLALHIVENTYLNGETIRCDGGLRMLDRERSLPLHQGVVR